MGWKKRLMVLMCAAVLVLGPALMSTARADTIEIYQVAENDVLVELPVSAMPAWIGGVLYVPCTVFDPSVTRVSLGVSYGQVRGENGTNLMLYSLSATLTFDLNAGTCTDRSGQQLDMRAVSRNGQIFVPLKSVCSYFGLRYSYIPTNYGTLIRITNGQEWLSNSDFIQYGERGLRDCYNSYMKQLNPSTPQPPPPAPPPPPHPQTPAVAAPPPTPTVPPPPRCHDPPALHPDHPHPHQYPDHGGGTHPQYPDGLPLRAVQRLRRTGRHSG